MISVVLRRHATYLTNKFAEFDEDTELFSVEHVLSDIVDLDSIDCKVGLEISISDVLLFFGFFPCRWWHM